MHYWVVAETSELLDEPKRYILQFLPPELLEHADGTNGRLWLHGDILIEFKTGHDPKRLVGSGLNGLWIEEAARMSPMAWPGFLNPTLADKQGWAMLTTTPLGEDWTHEYFYKPAMAGEPDFGFHTWRTVDNTMVPALVEEAARAKRLLPPPYYRREYEASYEAFIGQIYESFDQHTMVKPALPPGIQFRAVLAGVDWGFTAPGAIVVIGLTHDDHVWVIDEVYDANRLVETFWVPAAKKVQAQYGLKTFVADPAEPGQLQRFRSAGIQVTGHRNYGSGTFDEHARSVRDGIRTVESVMHQGKFHVLAKCANTVSELKSYRWDQERTSGILLEQPAKHQKEHAATAMRYAISSVMKGPQFRALRAA
jgi:phage terminase large subunit